MAACPSIKIICLSAMMSHPNAFVEEALSGLGYCLCFVERSKAFSDKDIFWIGAHEALKHL